MTILLDQMVEKLANAVNRESVFDFFDEEVQPVELDPVARITESTTESLSGIPDALATTDPFDDPIDIDAMTTSLKERGQARRTYEQSTPGSAASFRAADAATGLEKLTNNKFVNRMLAKEGLPYEWGFTGQPDPVTGQRAYDCSGIIQSIMQNAGFGAFPRVSGDIINHAKPISVKKALNTRGAVLWFDGHIAVSLGNGKTIEARGEDYGVVVVDAEHNQGRFTKGGILPELRMVVGGGKRKPQPKQMKMVMEKPDPESPNLRSITRPTSVFGTIMDKLEAPVMQQRAERGATAPEGMRGVKGQLYEGFMEAGRPDLAKMVFTKAFDTWIDQESGWRPGVVSPANNQGMPNGGLFQFWHGHEWAQKYFKNGEFTASPYQQAIFAATHFDLTANDIKGYAEAIRNGSYKGWG